MRSHTCFALVDEFVPGETVSTPTAHQLQYLVSVLQQLACLTLTFKIPDLTTTLQHSSPPAALSPAARLRNKDDIHLPVRHGDFVVQYNSYLLGWAHSFGIKGTAQVVHHKPSVKSEDGMGHDRNGEVWLKWDSPEAVCSFTSIHRYQS